MFDYRKQLVFGALSILSLLAVLIISKVPLPSVQFPSLQAATKTPTTAAQENPTQIDLKLSTLRSGGSTFVAENDLGPSIKDVRAPNGSKPLFAAAGASAAVNDCGIALSIASTESAVAPGAEIKYTLKIENKGKKLCVNPSLSAYYSDNESFVSATPKPTASDYYWQFANLKPGATTEIALVLKNNGSDREPLNLETCLTANDSDDVCATLNTPISGASVVSAVNLSGTSLPSILSPNAVTTQTSGTQEYGTWVWDSPMVSSLAYEQSVIATAVANHMTALYVTIDDYLTINALPDGPTKESKKAAYTEALRSFVELAHKSGLAVDVVAGWRDWAEDPTYAKGNIIIGYALAYNAAHTDKVRALQFDVEPYLLPTYEQNKAKILGNFVAFVDASAKKLGTDSLGFSIVIPHFYDDAQAWTPSFSYGGQTTYAFNHLLRIMDTRPNSRIIIMAYRNLAMGDDGSIKLASVEVSEASTGTHSTKIVVAQETGNVQPAYVTYYGTSKTQYFGQVKSITDAFSSSRNFGGIAVHYIDPFMLLK